MSDFRQTTYPVDPLFLKRWSPRAFLPQPMPFQDLASMFEAARWAPSAWNRQPWRFHYALRDDNHWLPFLNLLDPFNRSWAKNASALIFVASERAHLDRNQVLRDNPSHSFDTGAACSMFSLQATALGYHAHTVAGLDYQQARTVLAIPANFDVQVAIAVGRRANPETLPSELQKREQPSSRHPQHHHFFAGPFPQQHQTNEVQP